MKPDELRLLNKEIDSPGSFTIEALINQLCFELSEEEVVEFVKQLDDRWASYGFSEPLYRYFKQQHKQFKKECND